MRPTPSLISECPLNSNFSANHGDNEMIKIMKIIQTIKMRVTTQQTNTCLKSTVEKKFWRLDGQL